MFHASVAYLPSSFAMYTAMLGTSCFMDWRGGAKTALGMMWFGLGSIIGWPFAAALIIPFMMEELVLASITDDSIAVFHRVRDGIVRSSLILASRVILVPRQGLRLIVTGSSSLHRSFLLSSYFCSPMAYCCL